MKRATLIGVPVLGLLAAALLLRQGTAGGSETGARQFAGGASRPDGVARLSYDFRTPLRYKFDIAGALAVHRPSGKPTQASFTMKGELVIGPAGGRDHLVCRLRKIVARSESDRDGAKVKHLEGRAATVRVSPRGEILSVEGDDNVAVFLSHIEFVLPPGREAEWTVSGRDPAGSFTATYRSEGVQREDGRDLLRIRKEKKYAKTAGTARGFGFLPAYTATGSFDVEARRLVAVELRGEIPKSSKVDGVSMTGAVRMRFVFEGEEPGTLEGPTSTRTPKSARREGRRRTRSKLTFADVAPRLSSSKPTARATAVLQLTNVPGDEAREALLTAAGDGAFVVRAAAAQGLRRYRSVPAVLEILISFVRSDANPLVRMRAAEALKGTSSSEAREALEAAAAKDASKFVRQAAEKALAHPREGGENGN